MKGFSSFAAREVQQTAGADICRYQRSSHWMLCSEAGATKDRGINEPTSMLASAGQRHTAAGALPPGEGRRSPGVRGSKGHTPPGGRAPRSLHGASRC